MPSPRRSFASRLPNVGQLAEPWPHPADRYRHAGRRYTPAKAHQGTGADMSNPGAITEIDAGMPVDRADVRVLGRRMARAAPQRRRRRPDDQAPSLPSHHRHRPQRRPVAAGQAGPTPRPLVSTPSTRSPTRNRYNPNIRVSPPRWPKTGSPGAGSASHRNKM